MWLHSYLLPLLSTGIFLTGCKEKISDPYPFPGGTGPLAKVGAWMYLLQNVDDAETIDRLRRSRYDMLVLEPTRTIKGMEEFDAAGLIDRLRNGPDGRQRILLAWVDIGRAEEERYYWRDDWQPPTDTESGNPEFLVTTDPEGREGSYPTAYWDDRWRQIWLADTGIVPSLARDGFDGLYLSGIDVYMLEKIAAEAEGKGMDPAVDMMTFIREIRDAGRRVNPEFLILVRNAPYLIDVDPTGYTSIIDGVAAEEIWFRGDISAKEWEDAEGGDIPNDRSEEDRFGTTELIRQYRAYPDAGKPVFTVDYALLPSNAAFIYDAARRQGFRPLVTRVSRSQITGTPP